MHAFAPRFLPLILLTALPAAAEVPRVTADLPVTQSLVAQVMGDLGAPELLLGAGADPHHAQLRPSQARALAGAGLVVWTGGGLSPWLADPMATLPQGRVLDLSAVPGLHLQAFGGAVAADGDGDGEPGHGHAGGGAGDDAHAAGGDHDHDHGGTDPHLWLDPANAVLWLRAIADDLAALDPENAATYAANAEAAIAATEALRADVAATLAPARDTGLVMFHDAYGYFASAFGLTVLGTISEGDAAGPGAARIAALRETLGRAGEAGGACLFPEANHPDDYARVVAEGTSLRLGRPLDPAGMTLDPGPGLYAALLEGLAAAIADCAAGR